MIVDLLHPLTLPITAPLTSAITAALGGGFNVEALASAVYYIDQYSATPTPHIKNAVSSKAVSQSWLRAPRRMFNAYGSTIYNRVGVTASDGGISDPWGGTDASNIVGIGNWKLSIWNNAHKIPAGTWTLAIWARRGSGAGTDQDFAFSQNSGTTRSGVKTAASSYARFTHTFTSAVTLNASDLVLCSSDGATGANLDIIDFELFSGSSDLGLGADNAAGHAYFGQTGGYSPTVTTGTIAGYAIVNLPAKIQRGPFTLVSLSKQNSYPAYNGIISDTGGLNAIIQTLVASPFGYSNITNAGTSFANSIGANGTSFQLSSCVPPADGKYRQHAYTYENGIIEHWINDVRMHRWETTLTAFEYYNIWLNAVNVDNPGANVLAGFTAIFPTKLTATQMRDCFMANKARAARSGIVVESDAQDRYLAVEGDSITGGSGNCYPYLFMGSNDAPQCWGSVWAVSGNTLANLISRASAVDAMIPPNKNGRSFILSVLIGANDLGAYSGGAAQYITDLRAYCSARAAAGWSVALGTILPIDGNTTFNSRRATVNADIRANPTAYGLAGIGSVFDFGGDAVMGPDNSRSLYPANWSDGVHPSAAGQAALEPIYRAVINSL